MEKKVHHKAQSAAARKLLLWGLQREYGIKELPCIGQEEHGKPFFTEKAHAHIFFNYSHCQEGILCGISDGRIGVDLEQVRPRRLFPAKKMCHENELRLLGGAEDQVLSFIRIWVLKESYVKYTGEGLGRNLKELDFSRIAEKGAGEYEGAFLRVEDLGSCCLAVCAERLWDGKLIKINR